MLSKWKTLPVTVVNWLPLDGHVNLNKGGGYGVVKRDLRESNRNPSNFSGRMKSATSDNVKNFIEISRKIQREIEVFNRKLYIDCIV